MTRVFALIALLLAGCAMPMGDLKGPPEWCLTPGPGLPPLKSGMDLVKRHAALMRLNKSDSAKLHCLRRYAKVVAAS